jgi:hypothetical protein
MDVLRFFLCVDFYVPTMFPMCSPSPCVRSPNLFPMPPYFALYPFGQNAFFVTLITRPKVNKAYIIFKSFLGECRWHECFFFGGGVGPIKETHHPQKKNHFGCLKFKRRFSNFK